MVSANVRTPREVEGDLDAQFAANEAGGRGLVARHRAVRTRGRVGAIDDYLDHSERALRASLDIPEGPYSPRTGWTVNGHSSRRILIRAEIVVATTGDIYVDFTGTDAQSAVR